jgi:hypothetical protein
MVVLAGALLVTVGNWGIYRGGEALAQEVVGENYKCYVVNQGTAPKEAVTLTDQFGTEQVTVSIPQLLCTPAQKCRGGDCGCTGGDCGCRGGDCALDGDAASPFHLKCYNITPAGPPVNQKVTVTDQFFPDAPGDTVKVQTAQYLCELACKNSGSFPNCGGGCTGGDCP